MCRTDEESVNGRVATYLGPDQMHWRVFDEPDDFDAFFRSCSNAVNILFRPAKSSMTSI
jgi:hypothetical protein